MSLIVNLKNLTTRVATEFKAIRTLTGALANLQTSTKTSLVAAINEVKAAVAGAAGINDATTSSTSTWSSQKTNDQIVAAVTALVNGAPGALDTLKELADQLVLDESGVAALTTAVGNRVRFDAAQGLTAPQKAQARSNIDAVFTDDIGDTSENFVADFEAALL